ncbi:MAG: glycosyltransferase family 4 protein [Chthoniobacteraceae bacterium]|jgi:glycosyltransferase involved in cell wall biosynthesis
MSVVFINCAGETFTPTKSGAISTWIWEVCRAAKKEGAEPWVITRTTNAEPHPWRNAVLLEYPWIPSFRGTGIGRLLQIQRQLGGWGHVRQGAYARRVVRAIRERGLERMPFILHNDPEMAVHMRRCFPQATIMHLFHNANSCGERCRREFGKAVTVAAGVSDFITRWQGEYFAMDDARQRTIYNGVDIERFAPCEEEPDGPAVINFLGRTDASKAPDLLLRAAKQLARKRKDFSVQILGARYYWGSEPDDYQRMLDKLSGELEEEGIAVRRPGVVSRHALPGELRKAHIHVVPSRWDEPFGLATVEGMATGLATVASRTGGTMEVVGDAGFLFGRDSEDELAGHLETLVGNRELRSDYGRKARIRAERFTWDETWAGVRKAVGV